MTLADLRPLHFASECNGTFAITVDEPLDPAPPPASNRADRAGAR